MPGVTAGPSGVYLDVYLQPRASRNEVVGWHGEALRVRLQAPPVDGRANKALTRYMADLFRVAPSHISLVSGERGRRKRIEIRGVTVPAVRSVLEAELGG